MIKMVRCSLSFPDLFHNYSHLPTWASGCLGSCAGVIPQTVLALRGSNGVGFRVGLLIVRQPVDGTPPLSNTVYMQSKSMSRSSRAGETGGRAALYWFLQ